jgi:hypothetical protein
MLGRSSRPTLTGLNSPEGFSAEIRAIDYEQEHDYEMRALPTWTLGVERLLPSFAVPGLDLVLEIWSF